MTALRTIELVWPDKNPNEVLDYSVDLSDDLLPDEQIASVVVQIRPSGVGELYVAGHSTSVYAQDNQAIVWLSGGVPGRFHLIRILVETDQGRTYEYFVTLRINEVPGEPPVAPPPNFDFGERSSWHGVQTAAIGVVGSGGVVVNT
jgi:hypothetical protein